MKYTVLISDDAVISLEKMDKDMAARIYSWMKKNLVDCSNPRRIGKALTGDHAGNWRYRVGDYRILARILDDVVEIHVIEIGHRRNVYN